MSPLRVLQVIGAMDRAGAEVMIMNLYRAIDRDAVQFDFLVHEQRKCAFDDEIQDLGGRLYRLPRFNGVNYFPYQKACRQFFSADVGSHPIVHGHIGAPAAIYLSEAKRAGSITIAHSHNTKGPLSVSELGFRAFSYPTRFVADYFFACSMQAGIDRYGKGIVSQDNFYRIPNGIEVSTFAYSPDAREQTRAELGVGDATVIGHVGRFEEQKNHRFLIDIFQEFKRQQPDAKLLLAGGGPLEEEIRQRVKDADLTDDVVLLGVRSDMPRLFCAFDALLFPSIIEGFPVTLVEAQASGLPCLTSYAVQDESVLIEAFRRKELSCSPCEWATELRELLQEPSNRSQSESVVRAAGFDVRDTAQWLQEFYLGHAARNR